LESEIGLLKMRYPYLPALAVGIGTLAGLRPMTAPAVIAWALKRRWIRPGNSPFATMISAGASRTITEVALSELIADKLPFTPSRLNARPLASRVVSGAICGATVFGAVKRSPADGAILGGLGAIVGALAGYHVRKRLSRNRPDFEVALLEDAVAIGGSAVIAAMTAAAPNSSPRM
jgi:uncharacterized membrane protein